MKNICLSFSVLVAAFAFSGCSKGNSAPANSASVMFVDGCSGTTGIYAKANNQQVTGATNISFLANSGYQYITAGSGVTLSYFLTTQGTPLTSQSPNITANTHYSLFAGGIITNPSFLLATDDLSSPASGNAKIRFVNLSSDGLNETASVGDTTFASGITANTYSSFYAVKAGSYIIKAGDPSNISTVVITNSMLLAAGKIYTVMLTGTQLGSGTSALSLTLINNN